MKNQQEINKNDKKTENPTEQLLKETQVGEVIGLVKEVKKKQVISASYTIRAFGENIKRLTELGLIDETERKEVDNMQNKIISKWIAKEFK